MTGLILAAAGSGSRFGASIPKQFLSFKGKPLYQASLLTFAAYVDEMVVVVPPDCRPRVRDELEELRLPCACRVAAGGRERQDSVYQGLRHLSDAVDLVVVHDAARPHVSERLIEDVIASARLRRAAIAGLAISETVKQVADQRVVKTVDRAQLRLIQTPQAFQRKLLEDAFEAAFKESFYGTDESTLVERLGAPVHVVPGDPRNIKVTWREDLAEGGPL